MDLLQNQDRLQKEGKELLSKIGLMEFLSRFGTPEVVGSMASGLMVWRDIDIEIVKEKLSEDDYWETVKFLFGIKDLYHNLFIQDFRKSVNPNTPKGLYIGTKIDRNGNTWKLDIWFMPPRQKNELNYNEWIKNNLSDENKKIILQIKNQINNNPKYKKEIFSIDIYKAVFNSGVKDMMGFSKYLSGQGKNLV
jgi:hypothetical protein